MRRLTTEEFIEKARNVHGDKYDYSMVVYVNSCTPVMIVCPEHGMFLQRPGHHLSGSGCISCCGKKQLNTEDFIQRAREIHGDKYDYSIVEYVNNKTLIKIICPEHGVFEQTPNNHVNNKNGCPLCANNQQLTTEDFIQRTREVHGDKYDYSLTEYKGAFNKIEIICPEHGVFEQTPTNHVKNKYGCPKCAHEHLSEQQRLTTREFIQRARKVHGGKYDYSTVDYVDSQTKIKIICKKHGEFMQTPNNHLDGHGCSQCNNLTSKTEKELCEFVKQLVPHLEVQNNVRGLVGEFSVRFKGDKERKIIKNAELDIYIPELRLAIEYNGMYWHDVRSKGHGYHLGKRQACDRAGIRMMTIWEADWNDERKRPIIIRMLKNALGVRDERTVYARKCYIAPVPQDVYREFMNANHVQGYASAKEAKYGLYERGTDELVACMSFKIMKNRDQKTLPDGYVLWDMVRYATSCNVPGGRSKLFKFLREEFHMDHVQSFLDADYFTGVSYATGGWVLAEDNQHTLDMWHPKAGRQSRQAWWHAAIPRTLEKLGLDASLYDPNLTQNENAYRAGVRFFENSGNRRYEWHRG